MMLRCYVSDLFDLAGPGGSALTRDRNILPYDTASFDRPEKSCWKIKKISKKGIDINNIL